ncbi:efflux RND transporter permease subunit [Immundisolibacter sp.]
MQEVSRVERFAAFCIARRKLVVSVIFALTVVFGYFAAQVEIKTIFHDLLPKGHPFIQINDKYNERFGGPNIVSIMVEAEQGDIFQPKVLERIKQITDDLYLVPAINQFQVISLASRKIRSINSSTAGIETKPMMWPDLPRDQAEIDQLREQVLASPLVYGRYVSPDLRSALVTADFIDRLIDYPKLYDGVMKIAEKYNGDGVRVRVVGEPLLTGWVVHYLPETFHLFLITIGIMAVLLFITVRTLRGVLLPMLAGMVSALWSLGIASLLHVNFDPLIIVVAFLVTARAISHAVQMLAAFDDEIERGYQPKEAAAKALVALFRPGMLGVVVDAVAVAIVAAMPMPLLQKTAFVGAVWLSTIAVSAMVLVPTLLSWVSKPYAVAFPFDTNRWILRPVLDLCGTLVLGRRSMVVVLIGLAVLLASGFYATRVTVGDALPGTPLLWPSHPYNVDAKAINDTFQGSDQMFVVLEGAAPNALKEPELLTNVDNFQRYLETQPQIGGTVSVVDLIGPVNANLHEGNRRFEELGPSADINGELLFMYMQGTDPGDMDRFVDTDFKDGAMTMFFRDHKGDTIRMAVSRIEEYIEANPLPGESHYRLAGGLVGVLAAVNEEVFARQVESIALALLALFVLSAIAYRSTVAGLFYMPLVVMANTITFAFMAWKGIGMNINTLPVAALGIGLGVDYAFYIVDGVKERFEETGDAMASIRGSLRTAGRGVLITGGTMIAAVLVWYASSLKFQAEMGLLMALWLSVSAITSLLLIPAMIYVFRPVFVFGDGNAHAIAKPVQA